MVASFTPTPPKSQKATSNAPARGEAGTSDLELANAAQELLAGSNTSVQKWRGKELQSLKVLVRDRRGPGASDALKKHAKTVMMESGGYAKNLVYLNIQLEAKFEDGSTDTGVVSLVPSGENEWRVVPATQ